MLKRRIVQLKQKLFPELFSSTDMLYFLRSAGIKIGKGTIFYHPGRTVVDVGRPCLLEIGEYCKITSGVTILTHDYSRSVLRRTHGEIIGEAGKTVIGDNVFIGMNAVILMGTKIGSNVIIGAGAVVSGNIPDNVVVAGNPARVIRTIQEHYEIRKAKCLKEAVEFANCFKDSNGRWPTTRELNPFFPLFLERSEDALKENKISMVLGGDNEQEVLAGFLETSPSFSGYEDFIAYCEGKK